MVIWMLSRFHRSKCGYHDFSCATSKTASSELVTFEDTNPKLLGDIGEKAISSTAIDVVCLFVRQSV